MSENEQSILDLVRARIGRTDDMIHQDTRALGAYWERLRMGRDVPYRAEVDPRDMACDARNLFILEDLGGSNLRFRLAGSALVQSFGIDLRGLSVRMIMQGKARESMAALIEETLAEPGIGYARLIDPDVPGEVWEVLLLPLRSDSGLVDRVLGALVRLREGDRSAGEQPPRLAISEMSIRPVSAAMTEPSYNSSAAATVGGLAEEQAPFVGPSASSHLVAIDGGRSDGGDASDAERRAASRAMLRIVKDD